eukprot:2019700-Prymnesium_polylepis.1
MAVEEEVVRRATRHSDSRAVLLHACPVSAHERLARWRSSAVTAGVTVNLHLPAGSSHITVRERDQRNRPNTTTFVFSREDQAPLLSTGFAAAFRVQKCARVAGAPVRSSDNQWLRPALVGRHRRSSSLESPPTPRDRTPRTAGPTRPA